MSASPRVYLDLLCDLLNNFIRHGFTRIPLSQWPWRNDIPAKQAVFETRQQHRTRKDLLLLSATYWEIPRSEETEQSNAPDKTHVNPSEADLSKTPKPESWQQQVMGHACEWETSMILRIRPDLVGEYANLPDQPHGVPFTPAYRGWVTQDRANQGHIGSPSVASTEKGEYLFERFKKMRYRLFGG